MKLGYKIRDLNSNNSRPRVFFISHDDDHEEYLSRVISMLHGQSDCMVYFRDVTELHKSVSAEDIAQTLADMLEEALFVRQQAYMMGRHLDFKAKKENLRRRIDDLYLEHPELRRWRVALLRDREEELQRDKEALLSGGFVVMDQRDFASYNTYEFVDETVPDIVLVDLGKAYGNLAEKIRKWKKDNWLDRCKVPLLIAADAEYEDALRQGAEEENYGYIIRPYTDDRLISTVRKIVEK